MMPMSGQTEAPVRAAATGFRDGATGPTPQAPKRISAKDPFIALGLLLMAVLAWTTTERACGRIARLFAPLAARLMATRPQARLARIEALIGDRRLAATPGSIVRQLVANAIEDKFQLLRSLCAGWTPVIDLSGEQHIAAALERGHGVVLWVGFFSFRNLITKMALHDAGFAVSHLIHPRHGFSSTRFAMRFLNPVQAKGERRYLRDHIVLSVDGSIGAVRALRGRLRDNAIVSLTARETGSQPISVRFLAGEIEIAAGAPTLAYTTKAALLPVFAVRRADGTFAVIIEPPLGGLTAASRRAWLDDIVGAYAKRLETYVRQYPGQWCGWKRL
jgi:lauroyl/myristoyl acyltransferase